MRMKSIWKILGAIFLAGAIIATAIVVTPLVPQLTTGATGLYGGCDEVVEFPDSGLEAAIRHAIGKQVGDICRSELECLTSLDAVNRDITNLTGIEYCINLVLLNLNNNHNLTDLSPLQNLCNLEMLYFMDSSGLSDISPLQNLINLEHLDLGGTQVSNLLPLQNLTNLEYLHLWGTQVTNVTPLQYLTNLELLGLDVCPIDDIAPLVANSGLGAGDQLYIQGTNLDLTPGSDDMNDIQTLQSRGVTVHY